ncbi:MAG: tetratricopeptide repeat protein [Bacteroidetes bacterium]|nr:tetratricopeptide repeat protein [Bacteroidota bacterium]
MKLILVFFLVLTPLSELNKIAKINAHKKEAKEAYLAEDFEKAAFHYRFLVDSLGVSEGEVLLNLANSLYKIQDTTSAKKIYHEILSNNSSREIKSIVYQQLGAIDFNLKKYKEALNYYKNAVKQNPENGDVRYNYELLKKLLEEQENTNQEQQQDQQNQENKDDQNQDQQNKDQQNQEQQNKENQEQQENQQQQGEQQEGEEQQQDEGEKQEQEESEEGEENDENPEDKQPTTAEKLEEMNISEEKARMILEAMKNKEIQYIQQNKRKAKKPKKSGKPDW